MVPFAGYSMPVQYTSIIEEHKAVREHCGLFDASHMGEFIIKGKNAGKFLESVTCNHVVSTKPGQIKYNAILNDSGGVKDDVTIFRESEESYFVVVNAANREKILSYLNEKGQNAENLSIEDRSDDYGLIAIQGPSAVHVMKKVFPGCENIQYFYFEDFNNAYSARISRTGYTGEDGFEIFLPAKEAPSVWQKLTEAGKEFSVKPCGLGARDTLRLEACYSLYGHELSEDLNPVESGIGWIVKEKEIMYPKMDMLLSLKKSGPEKKITSFQLTEGGVPRDGYEVYDKDGNKIGEVKSGAHSPVLKKGIGTALLPVSFTKDHPNPLQIKIREKFVPAETVKAPFIKGTAGKT